MIFEAKMVAMEILNTNHTRFTLPIGVRTEVATHYKFAKTPNIAGESLLLDWL